jgi:hypothetical protein
MTNQTNSDNPIIDLDIAPIAPKGWSVIKHKKGGAWKFNPDHLKLFYTEAQKNGRFNPSDIEYDIRDEDVMNANLLGFLVANPDRVPKEWMGKAVMFWGTIFRDNGPDAISLYGDPRIGCLAWDSVSKRHFLYYCPINVMWNSACPAVVHK